MAAYTHLSYAATAYGAQGVTVDASHTILTDTISAAGLYVGMTRGRDTNWLHVAAANMADARAQFVQAMQRDRADRGLLDVTQRAVEAVRGLTDDGPVKLVTTEVARLTQEAARAERQAARWEQIAERRDQQRATHRAEDDENADALRVAEEHAARMRVDVAQPLTVQAKADGTDYLTALTDEDTTRARLATVGRFGRRKAEAEHRAATEHVEAERQRLRVRWGDTPHDPVTLSDWAGKAATLVVAQ